MIRRVLLLCFVVLLCSCQSAPFRTTPRVTITGGRVLDYGIYRRSKATFVPAPETSEGRSAMFGEAKLLKRTDRIHARVGTVFGFDYMLTGIPSGAAVDVVVELTHPPIRNPNTRKTVAIERCVFHITVGAPEYTDVQMDADWNVVPGRWTLRVIHGSRVLLEKTFYVITSRPNQALQPTAGRSEAASQFMKTHPLQATLAPTSGG